MILLGKNLDSFLYFHIIIDLQPTDIDKRNCIMNNKNYLKLHDLNFVRANTSFLKQFYFYDRL